MMRFFEVNRPARLRDWLMARSRQAIFCLCTVAVFGTTCSDLRAAAPDVELSVFVDRVVYAPGARGLATVKINLAGDTDGLILKSTLEHGLTSRVNLPDVIVHDLKDGTISIPFSVPSDAWGCTLRIDLFKESGWLAGALDVFTVGTNPFRLGQQSSWSESGPDLIESAARRFEGDDGYWPTRWREMKGTWHEIYVGQPAEVVGLATDWDQWITMTDRYRRSKKTIRAFTEAAHRLGMKVTMYNNATPAGWLGTAWARRHPEWLAYNYMGGMLGHSAKLYVEDLEEMKTWHITMDPGERPAERWRGFQPFHLAWGADPGLVDFACDQMLSACEDFGYDGVRFDGHWEIGQFWTILGYDLDGRRLNHGQSIDAANTRITRQMKKTIGNERPDFLYGYNYGLNYEYGAAKSPDAFREACSGGGMILFEGGTFDESHSDWRIGARAMRDAALRVHQQGGNLYGQARMLHAPEKYPVNDFSLRYLLISNFAATSHIYGGVYRDHRCHLPLQDTYYRFALRYGDLLYDEKLRPVEEPAQHLAVTVGGKEHPDLWWSIYTYKRQLDGAYQLITHLVNMPAPGVNKENSTIDKQPAPLNDVHVSFTRQPARVFVLDPEEDPWIDEVGNASSLVIPELKSWKIVIQEFPGSCADIPEEIFTSQTFDGKDVAPDPENGRIVFPISSFARGEECARLIKDDGGLLGQALYCQAASVDAPSYFLDGPRQECASITGPGRARVTFRLKVADNSSTRTVFDVSGPFGSKEIACNAFRRPGVYEAFAYEYEVREGESGYMTMHYHGVSDLWVDSIVIEQLDLATDRDRFKADPIDVASLPARNSHTKKVHLVRGLWHEYFGFDEALERARMQASESWQIISSHVSRVPSEFPETVEEFLEYDLVALLNIAADELQPNNRKNLREYVHRGGTLFVGGGTRAFGHGGYANTFLADLLPVTGAKLDLEKAEGDAQWIRSTREHELTKQVFSTLKPSEDPFSNTLVSVPVKADARNIWIHRVQSKPRATVLLEAGDQPLLTIGKFGRGTVYAMTGTPLGELADVGTPWWDWKGWETILDNILKRASGKVQWMEPPMSGQ